MTLPVSLDRFHILHPGFGAMFDLWCHFGPVDIKIVDATHSVRSIFGHCGLPCVDVLDFPYVRA